MTNFEYGLHGTSTAFDSNSEMNITFLLSILRNSKCIISNSEYNLESRQNTLI